MSSNQHIERLRAHAEQAIVYEEEGAKKDGRVPDETWDEWQRGKDILSLIEQLKALRAAAQVVVDEFNNDNPFFGYSIEALGFALHPETYASNPASEPKEDA